MFRYVTKWFQRRRENKVQKFQLRLKTIEKEISDCKLVKAQCTDLIRRGMVVSPAAVAICLTDEVLRSLYSDHQNVTEQLAHL